MQKYAVAGNLGISGGIGIAQFLAVMICPTEQDGIEAMKKDENWRIVFGFGILLNVYGIIAVTLLFREPSLKDFLRREKDDKEKIYKELKKIYIPNNDDNSILDKISHNLTQEASHANAEEQITWKEAYTGEKYRLTHWHAFLLAAFAHFTGMAFIIIFLAYIL